MANENEVAIAVTADNKTKAGFESVTATAKKAGREAGDGFGKEFESTGSKLKLSDKALKGLGASAAVVGTAAGATFIDGFGNSVEQGASKDKLTARLGLSEEQSARAGKVAGDLYASAYGESLDEVSVAIEGVIKNVDGMATASEADLSRVSAKVLSVATAFDQDLGMTTASVGQMIRTGLAKDADEALDIITKGLQSNANKADDLLETYNEYGTQFRKLGLNGQQATGLLSQGLRAGARDADIVADALKEFSIRSLGSLETVNKKGEVALTDLGWAFKQLGMDGEESQAKLAAGGKGAADALQQVLTKLANVKDPVERSTYAVSLFGTQAEDLGDALYSLDLSKATKEFGNVEGAADKLNDTLGDNAKTKIESAQRSFENFSAELVETDGAIGDVAAAAMAFGSPALAMAGAVAQVATAMLVMRGGTIAATAATVAGTAAQVVATVATSAWAAAVWVLNVALAVLTSPITLVVAAIALLVAGVIIAYKKCDWFRDMVNAVGRAFVKFGQVVVDVIGKVVRWITRNWRTIATILAGPVGIAVRLIARNFDKIEDAARALWRAIKRIAGFMFDDIPRAAGAAVSWAKSKLQDLINFAKSIPGKVSNSVKSGLKSVVPGFASGGVIGDSPGAASGGPRSGLVMVGEQGRELVRLPAGAQVMSNPDTEAYIAGAGSGRAVVLELRSSGAALDDFLLELLRRAIRIRGGNVQVILGNGRTA